MNLSIQQVFRGIFRDNLPLFLGAMEEGEGSSLAPAQGLLDNEQYQDVDEMLQKIALTHIKTISFVHEISARKWVYYGYILEHYPNVYYKLCERLSLPDLCLMQVLLACDNIEEEDCGQTHLQ